MRVLLDTCVLMDLMQKREPFCEDAKQIFLCIAHEHFHAFITANSITDIYYIVRKATHNNQRSKEIIQNLFNLLGVLDTTGMDCQKALLSPIADYEDAVMVESAKRANMDCIVTRNEKDYTQSSIIFYTPKDFLNLILK